MRRAVAKWWASVGPKALQLAQQIGKADETHADALDADVHIGGGSESATSYLGAQIGGITRQLERHSDSQFKRIGIDLKKSAPGVAKLVPGFRKENVGLIKTMLDSEKSKIEQLLKDGGNRRVESLTKDIKERFGIATRHAELIARDQTLKLNAAITRQRMVNAGITTYVWTTAGDERVRPLHDNLDGETFDFDDPPVTNDDGDTNNPGEDYQCRCVAYPIVPELEEDNDKPEAEPDEEPKPEPEAKEAEAPEPEVEAEPILAQAEKLHSAMVNDAGEARDIIREQVSKAMPGATSKDVTLGRGAARKVSAGDTSGANAYHDWNGAVVVAPRVKEGAVRAMGALSRGEYGEAFRTVPTENGRHFIRKLEDLNNLRTYVHEEVHGYSRVTPYSYGGVGRILEEVGTELTARDIVGNISPDIAANPIVREGGEHYVTIGGRLEFLKFGSYNEEIQAVSEIVSKHTELDRAASHALIRKSHRDRICAPRAPFTSPHEHLDEFLVGLDQPADVTQRIRTDLLRLAGDDGDIRLPAR